MTSKALRPKTLFLATLFFLGSGLPVGCDDSKRSSNDKLCATNQDCDPGQTCVDGTCTTESACTSNDQCSAPTPICNTAAGQCVQCMQTGDCGQNETCQNNQCVAQGGCTSNDQCSAPTPICNTAAGQCVQCMQSGDCGQNEICQNNQCTQTTDPLEAARQRCIDKINALRATKGRPPLQRWTSAEACADGQAASDESSGQAHGAFGQCGEHGQNECLGGGPSGIEGCLDSMWSEKDQDGCSGCDACADAYDPNCPNCDFYGNDTGDVCGHYVNMSANYFTKAACGFNADGSWAVIDFQ